MVPTNKTWISFNIPDDYIKNIDTRIIYRKISNIAENSNLLEIVENLEG